jgi:NhaC family Na+:H+ antiporter
MKKQPNLFEALIPIIVLIGFIIINVNYTFGDDALGGANQVALLFGGVAAGLIGWNLGYNWEDMLKGITNSISSALPSILILLLIGSLAGTWLISGITPAMISYGLEIMNPKIFLFATCLICVVVSLATGSSWTTVATVGVALLGIGQALGVHEGLTIGAIISGAYFGDKMSPLSDTTNLAPAMAGTNLFTHIKYMSLTTIPSIVITLIIFFIIGFSYSNDADVNQINAIQAIINTKFNITPFLFLGPVVVVVLILLKVKAIPAIFSGILVGAIFAISFQSDIVNEVSGVNDNYLKASYMGVVKAMTGNVNFEIANTAINDVFSTVALGEEDTRSGLLKSGGMYGMLNTIWLILCAMIFSGFMETVGLLKRLTQALMKFVNSTWSLVSATSLSCILMNFTASDQYISIVVPGKMFSSAYKDRGLAPENLSRTLEDSGTVTSVLCPWNTCNAYHSGVLGVGDPMSFIPYCFFNIISPVMTILFAVFMIRIKRIVVK